MKKQTFSRLTSALFLLLFTQMVWAAEPVAAPPGSSNSQPIENLSLNFSKSVPAGKEYVIYNAQGKKIRSFKAGESTSSVADCVQIPCPGTFGSDVVCWKCKERITSN